ncbi:flagellar hook-basal body complex protein FliE [Undibacterium flavidum]|uniref:Flagellar hook-basal body complex protein FliE n=1 Tax=Undibacterium flavidum TaxID=2762297 RepID=A0ABR6YET5_9BURK|nr:flagellar hook-basal body complex protein FliE [Undibacterium flavidum]MBC3875062.1 flagellar hook-basal body complex protein FliE [Undibacterium flavidum]
MEISAIAAIQGAEFLPATSALPSVAAASSSGFSDMVSQGIAQVNEQLLISQADLQTLATGDVQNLHQVMMRLEESRLSFQLMVQVRNRLLESYQEVMKMQI